LHSGFRFEGFRVTGCGLRDTGKGFRVSGLRIYNLTLGIRVKDSGLRVEG
jgi:hypothetical protein